MSFSFLNESPEFSYTVTVQPPPADTSEVTVYKQREGGEEICTDTLKKEGSGVYTLQLSGRSLEESPLWLKFVFEKLDPETHDVAAHQEIVVAVPLAEPVPGQLEAPPDSISGDTIEVRVANWGAHAYDGGDDPNYFPPGPSGPTEDRVGSDAKNAVKWKLTIIEGEGDSATRTTEDRSETGDCLNFSITDDHVGKTLEFEAYVGNSAPGHAKTQVVVPKVELKQHTDEGLTDAPAEVMLGDEVAIEAVVTPFVEGNITWDTDPADTDALRITPDRADDAFRATLTGLKATKDDSKPKLKPKFVSAMTTKETQIEHELAVTPRVLEFWFQTSPGVATGNDRGVTGLEFKVSHPDGTELHTGTTTADGKIDLQYAGDGTKLEIISGGSPVAEYTVNMRTEVMEEIRDLEGQQRRLRILGYHIGHAGDDQVGVDGSMGQRTDRAILCFQADKNKNFNGSMSGSTRSSLATDAGA